MCLVSTKSGSGFLPWSASGFPRLGSRMGALLYGLFLLTFACACGGEERAARLVEGEPQTAVAVAPLQAPEAHPAVGPVAMSVLRLSCYELRKDRFEYSICPFVNVTQRRVISSVPVLLGTWGGIYYNDRSSLVQEYQNGHHCKGTLMYRSVVRFTCDGDTEALEEEMLPALVDVSTDEEGCTVTATVATPFPCVLLRTGRASSTATHNSIPPPAAFEGEQAPTLEASALAAAGAESVGSGGPSSACEASQELLALTSAVEEMKDAIKDLATRHEALARVVDEIRAWTET